MPFRLEIIYKSVVQIETGGLTGNWTRRDLQDASLLPFYPVPRTLDQAATTMRSMEITATPRQRLKSHRMRTSGRIPEKYSAVN